MFVVTQWSQGQTSRVYDTTLCSKKPKEDNKKPTAAGPSLCHVQNNSLVCPFF